MMLRDQRFTGFVFTFAAVVGALGASIAHAQVAPAMRGTYQEPSLVNQFERDIAGRFSDDAVLRPQVAKPLNEAQALMNQPAAAAEKIERAESERNLSPYEKHVIARVKGMLAAATGDAAGAAAQYEVAAQGRWMTPADKAAAAQTVAGLYYNKQDYKQAAAWFDRYAEAGGTDPTSGLLRAQSYLLVKDYASSAKVLDAELGRTLAAAKVPPEIMLKLLAHTKTQISDAEGVQRAMQLHAQYYPAKAN